MKLVGICGAISSGKSTFAEMLTNVDPEHSLHLETSGLVVELANNFNTALFEHRSELVYSGDMVELANKLVAALLPQLSVMAAEEISLEKVVINPDDMAAHPDWYEKLFVYLSQAQQMPSIVDEQITADNKSNYRPLLQWIGGYFLYKLDNRLLWYEELLRRVANADESIKLIALTAPRQPAEAEFVQQNGGKVIKIERPGLESDTTDVTERMVASIIPDCVITNNGSLKDLHKAARKVHDDLLQDELKSEYTAH
jgi:hypothetical protein